MKMQEQSTPMTCPISTLYAQDFLVRLFQLLEDGKDLTMQEELSSLKLPELPPLKDLHFCYLKMFPDSYRMTAGGLLRPSSLRFLNWGTMSHGKCLTARILVFLNPENVCILSDFLESDVPEKYWLSMKQMLRLLHNAFPDAKVTVCIPQTESQSPSQALPEDSVEKPDSTK